MSTSKETVDRILALNREGRSSGRIAKELGMSKSTVADIIKREKARRESDESDGSPIPARTRATKGKSDGRPKPSEKPSEKSDDSDAPKREWDLTQEEAKANLHTFLNIAKRGYVEAHKSKDLAPDKRTWQEVQYLKLYKEAIRMMIECTGLDQSGSGDNAALTDYARLMRDAEGTDPEGWETSP